MFSKIDRDDEDDEGEENKKLVSFEVGGGRASENKNITFFEAFSPFVLLLALAKKQVQNGR